LSIILSHFPVFISNDSSVGANDTNINALFFYKYRQNNIIKTKYGRIKIKVRENRRSNQERTIQRHWQYWAHKTHEEDKQATITQHNTEQN
jgi:hypothetical protein